MLEQHEWLYGRLRGELEASGAFISDDVDERLAELTSVVLNDPANVDVTEEGE